MNQDNFFTFHNGRENNSRVELNSPTLMPNACGFLWNKQMLVQMNCRGYAVAQYMQPEPAKYSHGPNMESKTFIQPEHPYFSHHPGRFFYLKDEQTGEVFSAPYEPCRNTTSEFSFSVGDSDICWTITCLNIRVELQLTLAMDDVVEIWSVKLTNLSNDKRQISFYPYFSIGYLSWMNQSASFDETLNAIVADSVTPYQKVEDYFKNKAFKDKTYLIAQTAPTAWTANQQCFEGEGGLAQPDALNNPLLNNKQARYETPVAVMQYRLALSAGQTYQNHFLFGPAKNNKEIQTIKEKYLDNASGLSINHQAYQDYLAKSKGAVSITSKNIAFDDFINHWLPRQVFYHGDVNRLSTDPQTRNYLQDNLGMCYIDAKITRQVILRCLSQQSSSGSMPDGILLHPEAELKYINQIPHADHGIWLSLTLQVYLNETNDLSILKEKLCFADSPNEKSVIEHIELALDWLLNASDERSLSFIEQGDWCDPMNMVGYKGKGVSSWLSLASAYAINCWCDIVKNYIPQYCDTKLTSYQLASKNINDAVNRYFWDGHWYARGETDDGILFGISEDIQGSIFLNPQSWAILSGAANKAQKTSMLNAVETQLNTPYGMMMLAPSYTKMREDIGRISQKHPGVSENGSVYNHAAVFYAYSLYQINEYDKAFEIITKMLPDESSALRKGQLPVFIPNYYRGAYHQFPEQAGRSSHLFNTGTIAWVYRCIIEELCGLKGCKGNLMVSPKLPQCIDELSGTRHFLGAKINFQIIKAQVSQITLFIDGVEQQAAIISKIEADQEYQITVQVPK